MELGPAKGRQAVATRSQTNIILYSKTVGGGNEKQNAITASKTKKKKKHPMKTLN
jgi:hypothetical protein